MNKFWELMAGKLADRWAGSSLGSLVFWGGGLLATAYATRGVGALASEAARQPVVVQVMAVVGALVLVAASALLVHRLVNPALAVLQGPWRGLGLGRLSDCLANREQKRAEALAHQWETQAELLAQQPSPGAQRRYVHLDDRLRRRPLPSEGANFLPTPLGNAVRASDCRVVRRFGLLPATAWPRLWLILPEDVKEELRTARGAVDTCVTTAIWGAGFAWFGFFAWWAAVAGVAVTVLTVWLWLPSRIAAFADLIESGFELHRFALYEQLRLPPPTSPDDEYARGIELSIYLFRGNAPKGVDFTESAKKATS